MEKVCKKCGRKLPKTLEFFYKAYINNNKIIYQSKCKSCYNIERKKNIKKDIKLKPLKTCRKRVKKHPKTHKTCKTCNKVLPATTEYFYKNLGKYLQSNCKSCTRIITKNYKEKHYNN